MPFEPAPLPVALGPSFGCAEARTAGVSAGRLRTGDLAAPHRGVRVRAHPPSPEPEPLDRCSHIARVVRERATAYRIVMRPHAFFVGRTAAALYGLPLERLSGERLSGEHVLSGQEPLHVGVFAPQSPPRARGVHGIQTRPSLVTVRSVGGLRVSSPASTWAMLAGDLDPAALTRLGDALVRIPRDERGRHVLGAQLATIAQLRAAADAPGRRARSRLVTALRQIRIGSGSPLETDWRLAAAAASLPELDLDVEIRDARGTLLGIADAAHQICRVIVEVEGDHHRTDRAQWSRDIEKHAAYAAAGWELVRLTSAHVRSGRAVTLLRGALRRGGWGG